MKCKLVNVFSDQTLAGNGLTIFYDLEDMTTSKMLSFTQETRQFESIFVTHQISRSRFRAKIFTMEEELDFAGHPLIGLGAHLHEEFGVFDEHLWEVELNQQLVKLRSQVTESYYRTSMSQGQPNNIKQLNQDEKLKILAALNLSESQTGGLPLEVISLGLPYLIVPLTQGIARAAINHSQFEALLAQHGAKFVYVLDVSKAEGRTWDNKGAVEDIATGSAAGAAAYYLFKHGFCALQHPKSTLTTANTPSNQPSQTINISIAQGQYVGRPSRMEVNITITDGVVIEINVSGQVAKVADLKFTRSALTEGKGIHTKTSEERTRQQVSNTFCHETTC